MEFDESLVWREIYVYYSDFFELCCDIILVFLSVFESWGFGGG